MRDGATDGFKYFLFENANKLKITVRGEAIGKMLIKDDRFGKVVAEIDIKSSKDWTAFEGDLNIDSGKYALYFTYSGEGAIDFKEFELLAI